MTGSLQVKNGKYYAVLCFKDESGKRKQKWICTDYTIKGNKKAAGKVLNSLLSKYSDDKQMKYAKMLVADYFSDWLKSIKNEVSENTYRGYCGNMENHIIPYFKNKKICLTELKTYHLDEYYSSKLQAGSKLDGCGRLSATTIKHHHQNISKALSDAVRREIIPFNPAANAKTPKVTRFKSNFLNTNQLNDLLLLCKGTTIEIPIVLIAFYGFRRSEALGLCWDCVDFVNRKITIRRALLQNTGENSLKETTKNDSSYRSLPITESLYQLLSSHKKRQNELKKLMGDCYFNSDYVCTWQDGKVITPNYLTKEFHIIINKSELPKVRLHDLRHSTASNLLSQGYSIAEVQSWLGHASASTTLDFYVHIDTTSKSNMGDTLESCLRINDNLLSEETC